VISSVLDCLYPAIRFISHFLIMCLARELSVIGTVFYEKPFGYRLRERLDDLGFSLNRQLTTVILSF
ncbi:MAG: hypothetical protein OXU27_06650, partial [Candidatus Poribacteria bacterium]|nr:hypothetical protein [Candidatus Poribacteria bacterium]